MRLSTASMGTATVAWVAVAVGIAASGCGDDTTSNVAATDSGEEGSSDGQAESSQLDSPSFVDQGVDAPMMDGTMDVNGNDVTMTDAGGDVVHPADTGVDSSDASVDVAADVAPDVQPEEAGLDASPEAAVDAAPDGPTQTELDELAFAQQESTAICDWQLGCCPGGIGGYNVSSCESLFNGYGWEANQPQQFTFDRGYIGFNAAQAATCLATIKALPCGHQNGAQWGTVTNACELVLFGTIASGQSGCLNSFECASGNYCAAPGDGGVGVCTPLATEGQPCDTAINSPDDTIPDYMCSYLGSANTGLYCDLIDPQTSSKYATCQPLLSTTGATCVNGTSGYEDDQACSAASGGPLCGDTGCGTAASYPYPGFCGIFAIKDAGGD